jgi:hypothetical protein
VSFPERASRNGDTALIVPAVLSSRAAKTTGELLIIRARNLASGGGFASSTGAAADSPRRSRFPRAARPS